MIVGTGIDLVEIDRISQAQTRNPRFCQRVLSPVELATFQRLSHPGRQASYLAGRWAAKEAFAKALGTGIGSQLAMTDISITNDSLGAPKLLASQFEGQVHLSISHSREYAVAQVILEK
ncbi:4'-phosphopantetheinyl transferase [Aerococcus urinaehominis]|uniref:Holo-[acyl-carrier-protein] synthase n=1 Tax=Aerococcus urinaehominis TaxID=128944 RepID=A0A0X8FKW7_9LACT|nr:holo-ACP synthase [Aerococcus urinaehominis]AMB99197.1 4'-phosphopantetheinyl transferase [Aerococcus urinaehominis]SDM32677.1 holo-[acyl-carrier protein] synthase [Aerococcus urinaehominis]